MGYDHRADEHGIFEMVVTKWYGGRQVGKIKITGLEPYEKLGAEVYCGDSR